VTQPTGPAHRPGSWRQNAHRGNGDATYRRDQVRTAVIEVVLGAIVIVAVERTGRQRVGGLLVSVPMALVGFVAFKVGGF
jgi:hypothetical protein